MPSSEYVSRKKERDGPSAISDDNGSLKQILLLHKRLFYLKFFNCGYYQIY